MGNETLIIGLWICVFFLMFSNEKAIIQAVPEAQLLLEFRGYVVDDQNFLANWESGNDSETRPCNWTGVKCSADGYVTGVDLSNMNLNSLTELRLPALCQIPNLTSLQLQENKLSGALPLELGACTSLEHLNFGSNNFSGAIPAETWAPALQNLLYLNLSLNFFSGELPSSIGSLHKLQVLDVVESGLSGAVPPELGNLMKLRHLVMSWNNFDQKNNTLPESLTRLQELQVLECAGCNLEGELPEWLGKLQNLEYLDISNNLLIGSIPSSLMALENLKWLELYKNNLTGKIPSEIDNLTSLTDLDLSDNQLTGVIPEELARLENLAVLHLQNNSLEGPIPYGVLHMTKLSDMKLYMNKLNGSIPSDLGSNSSLLQFDVSDNNFHGKIPRTLCARGLLWRLMLFNNTFTGELPEEYGTCTSLIRLRLSGNHLSGAIPTPLWSLPNLTILELHNNNFSGTIPSTIANATNLSTLKLHNNQFSGHLPPELGQLTNLERFYAHHNNFSGTIPPDLATSLTSLYLDANSLSGEIPSQISNLINLIYLSLSFNQLKGTIPPQIATMEKLIFLDISHNVLSGDLSKELHNFDMDQFLTFNCSYNRFSGKFSGMTKPEWFVGNPDLCVGERQCVGEMDYHYVKKWYFFHVVLVVGVVFMITLLVVILVLWWIGKRRSEVNFGGDKVKFASERVCFAPWRVITFHQVKVSYKELVECLDEDNVIGQGGGGEVYKATLRCGREVAIKKLWEDGHGMDLHDHGFKAEVDSLGAVRHRNIVKLLCCCSTFTTNLLVYEYMPNGSLGDLLHNGKEKTIFDWSIRCKIAIGAAQGLAYLHHDCQPQILHRDIKSNNILLNDEYEAHIADFGLAKNLNDVSMSIVAGSYGYIAPEYAYTLNVNERSDVYSFGVVLLELVTGRQPIASEFGDAMTIVTWAKKQIREHGENIRLELIDKRITNLCLYQSQILDVFNIAESCTQHLPNERPTMRKVSEMLLDLQKDTNPKPWNT
ncbi:hypothetical protein KC19_4G105400 [Ceratodon purpureus]|uniref:non-specific serine/threonine protein kinase n=1 Tax=Ceratodon purpureus TaxID=3225 RepID=A0A8T0I7Q8_CERPU|nr:hypothetical protein KC19_4G105400 [Ceratodon purpureus]